jgi:hypothetical protein
MMPMYCRKCYTNLEAAVESGACPKCGRAFNARSPKTFLTRPFPPGLRVVGLVVLTTVLGTVAAFVVAFHQLVATSGH